MPWALLVGPRRGPPPYSVLCVWLLVAVVDSYTLFDGVACNQSYSSYWSEWPYWLSRLYVLVCVRVYLYVRVCFVCMDVYVCVLCMHACFVCVYIFVRVGIFVYFCICICAFVVFSYFLNQKP